jgi:hypothetical protein
MTGIASVGRAAVRMNLHDEAQGVGVERVQGVYPIRAPGRLR